MGGLFGAQQPARRVSTTLASKSVALTGKALQDEKDRQRRQYMVAAGANEGQDQGPFVFDINKRRTVLGGGAGGGSTTGSAVSDPDGAGASGTSL